MAYGTIYQFEYRDINDELTVVRIKQNGYVGAVTTRTSVNAGCEFAWGDKSGDLPIVYGSEVNVFVDAETDYEFLFLFSASSRKHLVEIDKGGSLFWKGFIEPDSWSEPLIAAPYPVEFTAYDMMGFLDELDFVDANGDSFEGKMTLIELIQFILAQTSLELPVHTSTDFEEYAQAPSTDYFAQHSVNLDIFAGLSYLEVLKQILAGHSIRQRNGAWWIISNSRKAAAGTLSYYIYAAGSASSSGTSTVNLEDAGNWWIEDEADMEMLPALRQLSITQDYGYQDNLLKNGDFKKYTVGGLLGKLSALKNWTFQNADVFISRIEDSRVALQIGGREVPPNPPEYNPQWQTEGIIHDGLALEPGNGFAKLTFKYGLMAANPGVSSHMFVQIKHTVGATVYYLRQFGNSTTQEMDYEWTTNGDDIRTAISLNSHYTSNYTGGAFLGARVNPDQVEGELYYEINDKLKTFTANIPAVPSAGNMQITLWKPFTANTDVMGAVFAEVGMEVLNAEEESYVASETLTVINSLENNHVPEDLKLGIGTIPDISNNEIIFLGGLLRANGQAATAFRIGLSNYYSWGELIARLTASVKRSPRKAYNGTFADLTPRMNLVIADKQDPTLKLIETGITYNDHMATVEGQYVQLLPVSLVAGQDGDYVVRRRQSADSKPVGSGSSGSSSGGSSATSTQVDNDERVATMDAAGARTSAPGYLDDTWFEGTADETTGKTYIRPRFFSYDAVADEVLLSKTLRITGSLLASQSVVAWVASAVTSDVLANLTATAPLRKSTPSNLVLDYNTTQFEVNASAQLQIKAGVLAPAAHTHDAADIISGIFDVARIPDLAISKVTGLQTALDGKQATITGAASTITASNLTASRALISDVSGKVAVSLVTSTELGYLDGVTSAIQTQINSKINSSMIGAANGVAPLNSSAKIDNSYFPDWLLGNAKYQDNWNASTNTPALPDATTSKGYYYIVQVAGTHLGIDFQVGDWCISNGIAWGKVDNTDAVTMVFGRIGAIVANESDYQSYYPRLSQSYADPSWISSLALSKVTGLQTALDGKVPTTRTVAGKALSANITLALGDLTDGANAAKLDATQNFLGVNRILNSGSLGIQTNNTDFFFGISESANYPGTNTGLQIKTNSGAFRNIYIYNQNASYPTCLSVDGFLDASQALRIGNVTVIDASRNLSAAAGNFSGIVNALSYQQGGTALNSSHLTDGSNLAKLTGAAFTGQISSPVGVFYGSSLTPLTAKRNTTLLSSGGLLFGNNSHEYSLFGNSERAAIYSFLNSSYLLDIWGNGKVGIGTNNTEPTEKLHVVGNILASGNLSAVAGTFTGAISTRSKYELRNATGALKWSFELSGDDLVLKNASGVITHKFTQAGAALAKSSIVAQQSF